MLSDYYGFRTQVEAIASEVVRNAQMRQAVQMTSQNVFEEEMRYRVESLEKKMVTIENLLGVTFGEDGGIKVMKEKE